MEERKRKKQTEHFQKLLSKCKSETEAKELVEHPETSRKFVDVMYSPEYFRQLRYRIKKQLENPSPRLKRVLQRFPNLLNRNENESGTEQTNF